MSLHHVTFQVWQLILLSCLLVARVCAYCEVGSVNFVRTSNVRPLDSLLQQIKDHLSISSLKCHQRCIDSIECTGYLYDRENTHCYILKGDRLRINHQNLIRSPDWSYHQRICLTTDSICSQAWAFESFGTSGLNTIADKIMVNLNSEENCLNACSTERQFICRSAIYDHANKTCSLHSSVRTEFLDLNIPDIAGNLLYMENHCIQQGCEIWKTHFEMHSGVRLGNIQPFKRLLDHHPGQCIQMCKQDEMCKSLNIDHLAGSCEFFSDSFAEDEKQQIQNIDRRIWGKKLNLTTAEISSRRIVARLNVTGLNFDGEYPSLDDLPENQPADSEEETYVTYAPSSGYMSSEFSLVETHSTTSRPITSSRPSTTRPFNARPSTARPSTARPTTTRPSTTRPSTERPSTSRPSTSRPSTQLTTHITIRPSLNPNHLITLPNHIPVNSLLTTTSTTSNTVTKPSTTLADSSKRPIYFPSNQSSTTKNPPQSTSSSFPTTLPPPLAITSASILILDPINFSTTASPSLTNAQTSSSSSTWSTVSQQVTDVTIPISQTSATLPSNSNHLQTNQFATSEQSSSSTEVPDLIEVANNHNDENFLKNLVPCRHCSYLTKVCLSELNSCGTDWTFEVMQGYTLQAEEQFSSQFLEKTKKPKSKLLKEKIIENISSRSQCQSACLQENRPHQDTLPNGHAPFICRAASFDSQASICTLYAYTRHTPFGKYVKLVKTEPHIQYLENNCLSGNRGFCTWKTQRKYKILMADRVYVEANVSACQDRCLTNGNFYCRSISFDPESGICALSHHSGRSLAQVDLFQQSATSIFSEISNCFSVSVDCGATEMLAKVTSLTLFQGKIYSRDRPQTCSVDIENSLEFSLPIQLTGDKCGTTLKPEAEFSNILVIQTNNQVLTSVDKAIGLKCMYNLRNITGEATLQFSELDLTDQSRSSAALPELSLHITDLRGLDRDEVNLGELLKVQIRLSEEDTYGIFVRNLIARDQSGLHNLTLIDQSGCPAHAKLMREMRTLGGDSKQLESYFEAFSFTGSSHLNLEAEVETCLESCRPVQCQVANARSDDDYETVVSYGRRRKRESNILSSQKLSHQLTIRSTRLGMSESATDRLIRIEQPDIDEFQLPPSLKDQSMTTRMRFTQINSKGDFCFRMSSLATFSGLTMLVQSVFFLIAALMINRIKSTSGQINRHGVL